jgi:hypothetical protein
MYPTYPLRFGPLKSLIGGSLPWNWSVVALGTKPYCDMFARTALYRFWKRRKVLGLSCRDLSLTSAVEKLLGSLITEARKAALSTSLSVMALIGWPK